MKRKIYSGIDKTFLAILSKSQDTKCYLREGIVDQLVHCIAVLSSRRSPTTLNNRPDGAPTH